MKTSTLGWLTTWLVAVATASTAAETPVDMNPEFGVPCVGGVFKCEDGYCVPYHDLCDGVPRCPDKSDEIVCDYDFTGAKNCTTDQFQCEDKECIPVIWRCNGEADCTDGSDERNCNITREDVHCEGFLCGNGNCISPYWQCDDENDCADYSDEANCTKVKMDSGHLARAQFTCNIETGHFPCEDSSFCIHLDHLCDGRPDCKDGSDEGPLCSHKCENFDCHLGCIHTPTGGQCRCPAGLKSVNRGDCEDEDECSDMDASCSQRCTNTYGNYTCDCDPGYKMAADEFTCIAAEGDPVLFYNTRDSVKVYNLRKKKQSTLLSHLQQAVGVACDGTYVYWTEVESGRESVMRAELTDPKRTKEALVQTGVETPEDIAVDWVTGTIYFTDSGRSHVAACSSDGRACAVIVTNGVDKPRAIELDVHNGEMYWSDWGSEPKIMRSYMDGSNAKVFVDTNVTLPNGIALDLPNNRLYWVDAKKGGIESIRLDGTHRKKIMEVTLHHPYWLSVFENTIYWSDWGSNTIQEVNKFWDKKRRTLIKAKTYGIQVYHPVMEQRRPDHICHQGLCSDLCLLKGPEEYACVCSEGRELNQDRHTCYDAVRTPSLLVTGNYAAVVLKVQALGKFDIAPSHIKIGKIEAIAYDNKNEIIYMFDSIKRVICWIELESISDGKTKLLITEGLQKINDMAYDVVSDVLYWTDSSLKTLEAYSIKRSARAVVYQFDSDEIPLSITLAPKYARIVISSLDASDKIHVDALGMDGVYRTHLFEHGFKGPMVRVRYHPEVGDLFLSDSGNGIIDSAHPLGTNREVFRSVATKLWSVAGAGNDLFWTDENSLALYWSNVFEAVGAPVRRLHLDVFSPHTRLLVTALPPRHQLTESEKNHPCAAKPPPCSHVCLQRSEVEHSGANYRCMCPLGMFLVQENGNCVERAICSEGSVLCRHSNLCVPHQRRCDGTADCPHGEDEEDCIEIHEGVATCSGALEKFACGSGECISFKRRCDGHTDCGDGSDEAVCEDQVPSRCRAEQFNCGGGICVDRAQVCDEQSDCPDGSDEDDCDTPVCPTGSFQCKAGNCVPGAWECDGDLDCTDGSDEHIDCKLSSETAATSNAEKCDVGDWRCLGGGCIQLAKRCDDHEDCSDGSDELDCEEEAQEDTECDERELMCPTNRTICVPIEARCNGTSECPQGEDEIACDTRACTPAEWQCHDGRCVSQNFLCDRVDDCKDGSDETKEACIYMNMTRVLPETGLCGESGYRCDSGHCLDLGQVCNGIEECPDGSDEHGACDSSCVNHKCKKHCYPTPHGDRCTCPAGSKLAADGRACVDRNECTEVGEKRPCAHICTNTDPSFICTCHPGFVIRPDRRSCKAVGGPARAVLSAGGEVWSAPARTPSRRRLLYSAPHLVADVAVHHRAGFMYVVSEVGGAVYRVPLDPSDTDVITITNIGTPSKVAVDWRTGAIYISDSTYSRFHICDVARQTCAVFDNPDGPVITAVATEPTRALFVYCTAERVLKRNADGSQESQLAQVDGCSALAPDSHAGTLYVAHKPSSLLQLHLDGSVRRELVVHDWRVSTPRSLAFFEDTLYLVNEVGNKFTHCRLFGGLACESSLISGREGQQVTSLALLHEALEPAEDSGPRPLCEQDSCPESTVCVGSGKSSWDHVCLCPSGEALQKGAVCDTSKSMAVILRGGEGFSGGGGGAGWRVTLGVLGVAALVAAAGFCYVYVKRRPGQVRIPMSVYFTRRSDEDQRLRGEVAPNVEIASGLGSSGHREFTNPLREMWRAVQTRVAARHTSTCHTDTFLSVPIADSDSDVESDRDTHDKARLI